MGISAASHDVTFRHTPVRREDERQGVAGPGPRAVDAGAGDVARGGDADGHLRGALWPRTDSWPVREHSCF